MRQDTSLRSLLRTRTRALHAQVEAAKYSRLLLRGGLTPEHVANHLAGSHAVWSAVEAHKDGALKVVWRPEMSRLEAIEADLACLLRRARVSPSARAADPCVQWWHEHGNSPRSLGFLYVLEGSALGGRVLVQHMRDRGFEDCTRFLQPYGPNPRESVELFCLRLEAAGAPTEDVIDGAIAGFQNLYTLFDSPRRAVA